MIAHSSFCKESVVISYGILAANIQTFLQNSNKNSRLWTKFSIFSKKVTATSTSLAVSSSEYVLYHPAVQYTPLPWLHHALNSKTNSGDALGTGLIGYSPSLGAASLHLFGCLSCCLSNKRLFMSNFAPEKVEPPSRPCGLSRVQQCECEWRCVECECE